MDSLRKYVDIKDSTTILGAFDSNNPKTLPSSPPIVKKTVRPTSAKPADLEIHDYDGEDLDSDDSEFHQSTNVALVSWAKSRGTPMSYEILHDLHSIIFPVKGKTSFDDEWLGKGFVFCTKDSLKYGLVQLKVDFRKMTFANDLVGWTLWIISRSSSFHSKAFAF